MWKKKLLNLFFPTRCICCRKLLSGTELRFCEDCLKQLSFAGKEDGKSQGDYFSVCYSPFLYEGKLRDTVIRYKFYGASACAEPLSVFLASCIYEQLDGKYDIITWVPIASRRLRERGYDQARLLAEHAAVHLRRPCDCLLKKTKNVVPLHNTSSGKERAGLIANAYICCQPEQTEGKRILLIDDIVTTRSTLAECAKTLLKAGAEDVVCATLAKTPAFKK